MGAVALEQGLIMNVEIPELGATFNVTFRYQSVYLIRAKNGAYTFETMKTICSANLDDLAPNAIDKAIHDKNARTKSMKTTCTISKISPYEDVTGKDKYKPVASCSVVCAIEDLPADKFEGRKKAFAKTVLEFCGGNEQRTLSWLDVRKKFWSAYKASHKEMFEIFEVKPIELTQAQQDELNGETRFVEE